MAVTAFMEPHFDRRAAAGAIVVFGKLQFHYDDNIDGRFMFVKRKKGCRISRSDKEERMGGQKTRVNEVDFFKIMVILQTRWIICVVGVCIFFIPCCLRWGMFFLLELTRLNCTEIIP